MSDPQMRCQWVGMYAPKRCENEPDVVIDTAKDTAGVVPSLMVCADHARHVHWLLRGMWDTLAGRT